VRLLVLLTALTISLAPRNLTVAESQRLAELEQRLARLEAAYAQYAATHRGDSAALSEARTAELRTLITDILADADTRAGLLSESATAGWDGHPFIASADGNFRLELRGRLQLRYVMNIQDEDAGDDTTRSGLETRRVRFLASGHVVDPSITYKLQATFDRNGGTLELEDAIIEKELDRGVYLRFGQFRPPLTRAADVSTFRTTAVERSLAHGAIQVSRSQGMEIGYEDKAINLRAAFHDGDGFANSPALTADTEFGLAARAELLLSGRWKQFRDFTGFPGGDVGLLLGAGVLYERGEFGASLPDRADDLRWTADVSAEFDGAHVFVAVGGRNVDPDTGDDSDVLIAMIEAGVFITDSIEPFARFEWGDDDSPDDLLVLTLGVTKFWDKHKLKWTTDVGFGFNAVSDTFASSGAGWRADPPGVDGQIVIRSQIQLMF
jgi:hypothetical protein